MDVGDSFQKWADQHQFTHAVGRNFPYLLREHGLAKVADEIESRYAPILGLHPWQQRWSATSHQINRHSGTFLWAMEGLHHGDQYVPLIAPGNDGEPLYASEDLTAGRLLDYNLAEQAIARLLILLALLVMLFAGYRLWRRRRLGKAPFIVPSLGVLLKMLCFGVLLPVTIYFVWTRISPFGGRELSLRASPFGHLVGMGAAGIALLFVPLFVGYRFVRRRVDELGIRKAAESAFNRLAVPVACVVVLIVAVAVIPMLRVEERTLVSADATMAVTQQTGRPHHRAATYAPVIEHWQKLSSELLNLPDELWEVAAD